jgi:hypothetical protein
MQHHPEKENFLFLTSAYEHVYYGGFELSPVQFQGLQKKFENFYKSAGVE